MSDEIIRPIQERTKREPLLRERLRASPLPFLVTDDLTETQKQQSFVPDFTWFIPNKLAALASPQSADVFTALREIGVSALLNLSETPLPANIIEKAGLRAEHIPLVGFSAPEVRRIKQALTIIDACLEHSIAVGVVGIRHASVILACYLVEQGIAAHTACDIIGQWLPFPAKKSHPLKTFQRISEIWEIYPHNTERKRFSCFCLFPLCPIFTRISALGLF